MESHIYKVVVLTMNSLGFWCVRYWQSCTIATVTCLLTLDEHLSLRVLAGHRCFPSNRFLPWNVLSHVYCKTDNKVSFFMSLCSLTWKYISFCAFGKIPSALKKQLFGSHSLQDGATLLLLQWQAFFKLCRVSGNHWTFSELCCFLSKNFFFLVEDDCFILLKMLILVLFVYFISVFLSHKAAPFSDR